MTRFEKTVKGLELLKQRLILQADILGYGEHISDIDNALELLKEQKPLKVLQDRECEVAPNTWQRKGFCPKCHQEVQWLINRNFCGFCGQAVKWDD